MKHNNSYKLWSLLKRDVTYILGASCSDGVVLVSDTKVTIEEGADYTYSKKITAPLNTVIMGAAGIGGLYKDFQNRIVTAVVKMEREREDPSIPTITNEEEFSVLVNKVIRDMHADYAEDRHLIINNLMIICATRIGSGKAQLTTFNPYGFPEPVNTIRAIGHGEPYGSLFLKKMWNPSMNMEQTAKLGLFIIKFIQDMRLDNSVGFSDELLPQVIYIPDIKVPTGFGLANYKTQEAYELEVSKLFEKYPIRELGEEEIKHFINEVSSKISDFENLFKTGQFKI